MWEECKNLMIKDNGNIVSKTKFYVYYIDMTLR